MRDARELERKWAEDPRWAGIERSYTADDVVALQGNIIEEHTLAESGVGEHHS